MQPPKNLRKALPLRSIADYRALTEAQRLAVATFLRDGRASGASGNELRAALSGVESGAGSFPSGPQRIAILREHGPEFSAVVAKSYAEYRDGDPRKGSRHAREHGRNRTRPDAAEMRKALRAAGKSVPRNPERLAAAYDALAAESAR